MARHDNYIAELGGDNVRRRLVRIFVTDPDKDVPLENAILYQAAERATDQTDSEIFMELGVPALLTGHNVLRESLKLKPIKIRDLNFCVATLMYF